MKAPASIARSKRIRAAQVFLVLAGALILAPMHGQTHREHAYPFHSPSPAGYNVILLHPSRTEVSILALVECPEMEGAQRVSEGTGAFVVSGEGVRIKHYPREVSFRITATLRKTLLDGPSENVGTRYDPRAFLLKLGFKLRIYHGLERREVFPTSVRMIGMPEDVPYDERIFRVSFDIDNVPVTDRMVLQIVSPENELLTHFTFGLL